MSVSFSSSSGFVGGESAGGAPFGAAALRRRRRSWPARAEEARLGDPGDRHGIRLVAAEHMEGAPRFGTVLAGIEADVPRGAGLRAAPEDEHRAFGRRADDAELQPVPREVGILRQRLARKPDGHAGLDEIAAPGKLRRVAERCAVASQERRELHLVANLVQALAALRLGVPRQPRRCLCLTE